MKTPLLQCVFLALAVSFVGLSSGCSGPPEVVLKVDSSPAGAQVFLSRRGEKAVEGSLGIVTGDMKSEPLVEDFILLGTTPLEYASPLTEREGGASAFGLGVKVLRRYENGVLRVEKEGFLPGERLVRFKDGDVDVNFSLQSESGERNGLSQNSN